MILEYGSVHTRRLKAVEHFELTVFTPRLSSCRCLDSETCWRVLETFRMWSASEVSWHRSTSSAWKPDLLHLKDPCVCGLLKHERMCAWSLRSGPGNPFWLARLVHCGCDQWLRTVCAPSAPPAHPAHLAHAAHPAHPTQPRPEVTASRCTVIFYIIYIIYMCMFVTFTIFAF